VDGDEDIMVMVGVIRGLFFVRMFTLRIFEAVGFERYFV